MIQILPYLLLLLLHHFVLAPLFFKKKLFVYVPVTLALLTAFGFYCFKVGNPQDFRQGGPGQFQGPPPMMQRGSEPPPRPDDMRPPIDSMAPMDGMMPPPDGFRPSMEGERPPMDEMRTPMMRDDHRRPMRPEVMKLLIGLLLVLVDLGVMAYLRNLHTEKQVDDLRAENQKHQQRLEEMSRNAANLQKAETELTFKTDYKQVRVKPDNILYIEGMGEYLKIYHLDAATPLVVLMSMKRILEQLPDDRFARVHKSYIVNLNRIINNSRTQITMENASIIPIGESYRVAISDRLKANS
ncbi:MAG: LytTR family transcriptional regulator DNA-binding domain-containing protein [Bacteroidaceae bacterium]|nr:LytTR family transcriptional regulator DNA-binding domain-containing protein [Bacteroidaceae bacterium]